MPCADLVVLGASPAGLATAWRADRTSRVRSALPRLRHVYPVYTTDHIEHLTRLDAWAGALPAWRRFAEHVVEG